MNDQTGNTDRINDLIASLADEAGAVAPAPRLLPFLLKWAGGSAFYVVAMLLALGLRPDLAARLQSPLFLTEIGLLAGITLTSAISAITLSFPDMLQRKILAWSFTVPLVLFGLFLLAGALDSEQVNALPPHNIECALCITLLSLLPAAWIMLYQRRLASVHYYLAGGIALLASSSLGCLILRLSEETDSFTHLITWHYLPMMVLGMTGLWLGEKFLKW